MKKTLALLLSVLLVFVAVPGLTDLVAEACDRTDPYGFSVCMPGDYTAPVLNGDYILDFGARVLGTDTITVNIPIYWDGFDFMTNRTTNTWETGASLKAQGQDWAWAIDDDVMNRIEIHFTHAGTALIFQEWHKFAYEAGNEAYISLVAERTGTAEGEIYITYQHDDHTTTRSAPVPINGRIIDPTINKSIDSLTDRNLSSQRVSLNNRVIYQYDNTNPAHDVLKGPAEIEVGEIPPESWMAFRLNTEFFVWDPIITSMNTTVRSSTMGNNRIGAQIKIAEGYRLIDEVKIENIDGVAHVVVRFSELLPYVTEKDFDFKIYLTFKGKRHEPSTVRVLGSIANEVIYVDGHDYVNMSEGFIAEVEGFSRNVHLDLGEGVSVYRNLHQGQKYYGVATDERTQNDIEIMDSYPTIRKVFNITHVNMDSVLSRVRLRVPQDEAVYADGEVQPEEIVYQVYDADGKWLGTTADMLPFRDKYYLSTQLIQIEIAEEEVNILEDVEYDVEMLEELGLTLEELGLDLDAASFAGGADTERREQDRIDQTLVDSDDVVRGVSGRIYQ